MPRTIVLVFLLIFLQLQVKAAENFWQGVQDNIKKAFTPSEYICDRYEVQEYEVPVLRSPASMPFTEVKPKKRECIKWEDAPKSAIGRVCKEYDYRNTSASEQSSLYKMVKRKRTVCVEGHNTR